MDFMTDAEIAVFCQTQTPMVTVWCPEGAPQRLSVAAKVPTDDDDPAETVAVKAGCRADPKTCPCATAGSADEGGRVVDEIALTPLALTRLRNDPAMPNPTPTGSSAAPTLRTLAGPADLEAPTPPDTPLAADRPVFALAGGVGLAGLVEAVASGDLPTDLGVAHLPDQVPEATPDE